jgi:hypothetical protein
MIHYQATRQVAEAVETVVEQSSRRNFPGRRDFGCAGWLRNLLRGQLQVCTLLPRPSPWVQTRILVYELLQARRQSGRHRRGRKPRSTGW